MLNKLLSTTSGSTDDKSYFTESQTGEVAATGSLTLPAVTLVASGSTNIANAAEPYQQSAHKVVVKRYAIKRD